VRFRAFGVPVEIRRSWWLLALAFGTLVHPTEPELILAFTVMATIAVLAHEAGHAVIALAYDASPGIVLHGGGGATYAPNLGARYVAWMAAAGPVAGFIVGGLGLGAVSLSAGTLPPELIGDLILVTFGWSAFNLLPLGTMDGRAVLDSVVSVGLGHASPAVGRVAGMVLVVAVLLATTATQRYDMTYMVAILAITTALPMGPLSRWLGAASNIDGSALLAAGRASEALAWADARLTDAPGRIDVMLLRAHALRYLTRWPEGLTAYESVLALRPGMVQALAGRSICRRWAGDRSGAREDQEALVAASAADPGAAAAAFLALYADDRFHEAAGVADAALTRSDLPIATREILMVLRGISDIALGLPELALPRIERRLAASPDDFAAHEALALALVQLGRVDDARRSARNARAGAPHHPELLETLAVTERLCGDPAVALPCLLEAATARPNLPRARAELAACFVQLGRIDEAAAALDGLPSQAAGDAHVAYARACLSASAGRTEDAAALLVDASAVRPGLGLIARWDPALRALHDRAAQHSLPGVVPTLQPG
jgi:tetratricopeptide (TPR) repeat protein/Zn-dependent protease